MTAETEKTLIIAEAGVNHNGDAKLAFEMVDAACEAQADIIKFQIFDTAQLVTVDAQQADYQHQNSGKIESQFDMLQRLELSAQTFTDLKTYCQQKQIGFLATAFDESSLGFLVDSLKVDLLKLPSGELTNGPLVLAHAKTGLDLIVSTGMANNNEIGKALSLICIGQNNPKIQTPGAVDTWSNQAGDLASLKNKVSLLHCISQYPTPWQELNLNAIASLKQCFGLKVGLSDHSQGITAPIAAVAMGARIIEKHFTLSHDLPGPDHKASLTPEQLTNMVQGIRNTEAALGNGVKRMQPCETQVAKVARRSLVANTAINKGEVFSHENLTTKRPGTGISANYYWEFIGKTATKNYVRDELIRE